MNINIKKIIKDLNKEKRTNLSIHVTKSVYESFSNACSLKRLKVSSVLEALLIASTNEILKENKFKKELSE